eukprot:jgi/Hompol1/2934/HPOL_003059-RA
MASRLDFTDFLILTAVAVLSVGFFYWRSTTASSSTELSSAVAAKNTAATKPPSKSTKKSLIEKAAELGGDRRFFAFFGSQTGTAEDLATRIAKEVTATLKIPSLVCDLEDYDLTELARWTYTVGTEDLFGFFVATYGEGEPTDNAVDFYRWIMNDRGTQEDEGDEEDDMTAEQLLDGLRYLVFGLGNTTYEHFNVIARRLDKRLINLGAKRVGELGLGDDDKSLEEDFLAWKPKIMAAIGLHYGIAAESAASLRDRQHKPVFVVSDSQSSADTIFRGELSAVKPRKWAAASQAELDDYEVLAHSHAYQEIDPPATFDAKNPFYSRIVASKALFKDARNEQDFPGHQLPASNPPLWSVSGSKILIDRDCYHIELDLTGSGLTYQTGDHVGVYAENSPVEVERLAAALNITDLDRVIDLVANPDSHTPGAKKPFPTPCTLRAALTSYVDLSHLPKQFHLEVLGKYAKDESEKQRLFQLSEDRVLYTNIIESGRKNLADILEEFKSVDIPLGVVLCELLPRITVRYYSISSSSNEEPSKLSITAVLVRYAISSPAASQSTETKQVVVKDGLATSWLQRHHFNKADKLASHTNGHSHHGVPQLHVPVSIRTSGFRLPKDISTPVIMIGPGTGVAPFRGFVRERMHIAHSGTSVGPTWLFYGCRNQDIDFLYRDEFEQHENAVKSKKVNIDLKIITAFSRQGPKKVYVQHRIAEYQAQLWDLVNKGGHIYICGDAKNMAREVADALVKMAEICGKMSGDGARKWLKDMRASGRYSEDVWS